MNAEHGLRELDYLVPRTLRQPTRSIARQRRGIHLLPLSWGDPAALLLIVHHGCPTIGGNLHQLASKNGKPHSTTFLWTYRIAACGRPTYVRVRTYTYVNRETRDPGAQTCGGNRPNDQGSHCEYEAVSFGYGDNHCLERLLAVIMQIT